MKEFEHMEQAGGASADDAVINDGWSVLSDDKPVPEIDFGRLYEYRTDQLKSEMRKADVGLLVLINVSSLRYAADYASYQLFQAHMPEPYLFLPLDGPAVLHGSNDGGPRWKYPNPTGASSHVLRRGPRAIRSVPSSRRRCGSVPRGDRLRQSPNRH